MIVDCIETGEFCTDTYLIIEGDSAIVIDPGADYEYISARLSRLGATAKYVLITHGHFDHIGAVSRFSDAGAKVYISRTDYDILTKADFNWELGFGEERVNSFDADCLVDDGDKLKLLNHEINVIATPGHTPGGVCYVIKDNNCIFTGDTLFRLSVGRTDFPYCSHSDLLNSVKKLFALPGDFVIYPGHGPSTTLDYERKFNPYVC